MTDKEDAFGREVLALEEYTGIQWLPRYGKVAVALTYTEIASRFREIARRAMACACLAEEAAQEVATGVPAPGQQ